MRVQPSRSVRARARVAKVAAARKLVEVRIVLVSVLVLEVVVLEIICRCRLLSVGKMLRGVTSVRYRSERRE